MTSIFFSYPLLGPNIPNFCLISQTFIECCMLQPWKTPDVNKAQKDWKPDLPEITLIGILFWFDCQSCQRSRQLSCSPADIIRQSRYFPRKRRIYEKIKGCPFSP